MPRFLHTTLLRLVVLAGCTGGGSDGTRAMMVFAQRRPESSHSLFGIGVDSPLLEQALLPTKDKVLAAAREVLAN